MLEQLLPLKLPPGLYKNGTTYQAKGRWFDANLVRFYEGAIRPVQGWRVAFDSTGAPMAKLAGTPRAALAWRSATGDALLAIGTTAKLYVVKDGTTYDITPVDFVAGATDSGDAGNGQYGDGLYGVGLYGEGKAPLAATLGEADTWQLDAFGDVLVACCTKGGRLYIWTGNTAAPAVAATGSPEPNRGAVITPERFVVALGAANDVRLVQWASQATTDTWTPLTTNSAGDYTLSTNGRIMCARRTKAQTLIWTDADLHSMNYIGGTFVYSFKQEGDNCGIVSPQAAAIVDAAAIWMGRNNFFMYDGFVKPVPCEVHDHVFDDFNAAQASKVVASPVSEFSEVWWFYPSAGSVENDRYVVYNYRENHWTVGTLARTAAVDRGALPSPVMFDGSGNIYQHEQSAGNRIVPEPEVARDTLAGAASTTLEAHTPSPGVFSWSKVSGNSLKFDASANLVLSGVTVPVYVDNTAVGTNDYAVSIKAKLTSAAGTDFGGVGARMTGTNPAGYYFGIDTATAVFRLRGLNAAGADIFTPVDAAIPSNLLGTVATLQLRVQGTALTGFVNGVAMCSKVDATYASGKAGVYGGGSLPANSTVSDTFQGSDGTFLEAHTPTSGDFSWVAVDNANSLEIRSNGLQMVDAFENGAMYNYKASGVLGADRGAFTLIKDNANLGLNASVTLRATTNPRSSGDGYSVVFSPLGGPTQVSLNLYRNSTQIGTYNAGANTWPGDGSFDVVLRVVNNATPGHKQIIASLDGVDVVSYDDASPLTGQLCGVGLQNASLSHDGRHLSVVSFAPVASTLLLSGPFVVTGFSSQAVQALENSGGATVATDGSVTLLPFLESGPIELGDGDRTMRVQRIVPDEKNLGDVEARFYSALFPATAETEHGPYTLSAPTPVRFTARQVRLRMEEARPDVDWRIGTTRLGVIPGGRR